MRRQSALCCVSVVPMFLLLSALVGMGSALPVSDAAAEAGNASGPPLLSGNPQFTVISADEPQKNPEQDGGSNNITFVEERVLQGLPSFLASMAKTTGKEGEAPAEQEEEQQSSEELGGVYILHQVSTRIQSVVDPILSFFHALFSPTATVAGRGMGAGPVQQTAGALDRLSDLKRRKLYMF